MKCNKCGYSNKFGDPYSVECSYCGYCDRRAHLVIEAAKEFHIACYPDAPIRIRGGKVSFVIDDTYSFAKKYPHFKMRHYVDKEGYWRTMVSLDDL